jgi:hypothetical protein
VSSGARSPLTRIPEENSPFAIGGDESDDQHDGQDTPSQSSPSLQNSRRPSTSSAVDESVPLQLRGMSEKARGKMPAGQPSFSRQNSITSQSSMSAIFSASSGFTPTVAWVSVTRLCACSSSLIVLTIPRLAGVVATRASSSHYSHYHFSHCSSHSRFGFPDRIKPGSSHSDCESSFLCRRAHNPRAFIRASTCTGTFF